MIEFVPVIITGLTGVIGVAIGYGIIKANVGNLKEHADKAERLARDTAVRLDQKVESLQKGQHQQDITHAATYVHKAVFEVSMGDLKDRLTRIEDKLDKINGKV